MNEGVSTLRKQKRKIQRAPQELSAERILNIHAVHDSQPSVVRQRAVFTVLCATLNVHDVGLRHVLNARSCVELQGKPSFPCSNASATNLNPEDLKAWVLGFPGEHWQSHKLVAKLPETLADSDAQVAI